MVHTDEAAVANDLAAASTNGGAWSRRRGSEFRASTPVAPLEAISSCESTK